MERYNTPARDTVALYSSICRLGHPDGPGVVFMAASLMETIRASLLAIPQSANHLRAAAAQSH